MARPLGSLVIVLLFEFVLGPKAMAHDSPSTVVEEITQCIAREGNSARLLVRRADEYRALRNEQLAIADYESALEMQSDCIPAHLGIALSYFGQSRLVPATAAAERGLIVATDSDSAGPFHAILAKIHERNGETELALRAWQSAITSKRPDVDWFLGELQSLWILNRPDDARRAVEEAMKRNSSIVLSRMRLRLLIGCGETREAEEQIAEGMEGARWKSSWLLLRARLRMAQNRKRAAHEDARAALAEIELRQSPFSVNPFLIADRGVALAILERNDEARSCAELARSLGVRHSGWKGCVASSSPPQPQQHSQ